MKGAYIDKGDTWPLWILDYSCDCSTSHEFSTKMTLRLLLCVHWTSLYITFIYNGYVPWWWNGWDNSWNNSTWHCWHVLVNYGVHVKFLHYKVMDVLLVCFVFSSTWHSVVGSSMVLVLLDGSMHVLLSLVAWYAWYVCLATSKSSRIFAPSSSCSSSHHDLSVYMLQ